MKTAEKIALLEKLLKRRYSADVYDNSAKNSPFRLRVDLIIYHINKLEEGVNNHE